MIRTVDINRRGKCIVCGTFGPRYLCDRHSSAAIRLEVLQRKGSPHPHTRPFAGGQHALALRLVGCTHLAARLENAAPPPPPPPPPPAEPPPTYPEPPAELSAMHSAVLRVIRSTPGIRPGGVAATTGYRRNSIFTAVRLLRKRNLVLSRDRSPYGQYYPTPPASVSS